jgi:hypothetical protein
MEIFDPDEREDSIQMQICRLQLENTVLHRALRIIAKDLIESDLMLEEMTITASDPDAYRIEISRDITDQVEREVQDYLELAREELCQN